MFFKFFTKYITIINNNLSWYFVKTQFFRTNGLSTEDARQKYSSRVAQLYRDKLAALSEQAMRTHGIKVNIVTTCSFHYFYLKWAPIVTNSIYDLKIYALSVMDV